MRGSHAMVAAVLALAVSSGCESSPEQTTTGGGAEVATLRSAGAEPSPAVSATTERPREKLGMTAEEYEALLGPYQKCMKGFGVDPLELRKKGRSATEAEVAANEKANAACEPQFFPLPPWERDPANPEARDFAVGVVKCLKDKGVKFVEVDDDGIGISLGGDGNDARSISKGLDLMPECERTVAAEMK
jgi:hypothetical protein